MKSRTLYGPVPMGFLSAAQSAALAPKQPWNWCFCSIVPWGPTPHWRTYGRGDRYVTTTVVESRVTTLWTPSQRSKVVAAVAGSHWYWYVKTTSSAENAVPSDHFTPSRSFHVT